MTPELIIAAESAVIGIIVGIAIMLAVLYAVFNQGTKG